MAQQVSSPANDSHLRYADARSAYRAQLDTLRSRLSQEAFHFFCDADVHDSELLELVALDGSRPAPANEPGRPWKTPGNHPVRVQLSILDAWDKLVWSISYKSVRRFVVDYPSEQPLFYREGNGFDDLGYHELTDAGSGLFRHEILFRTGAVLLFEFAEVDVSSAPRRSPQTG